MTTLLLERSSTLEEGFEHDTRRRLDGARSGRTDTHGRLTLDDLITGVWEGLAVRDTVNCPVCSGPMTSTSPAGRGDSTAGACLSCGSGLS
jgi:DnaJ-class molecular chaperone